MVLHHVYANAPEHAFSGEIGDLGDSTNTTVRCALLTSAHTKDLLNNAYWSDVSADEIDPASNDGYTAGGAEVTNNALSQSSGTTTFDGDDVVWSSSSITAYHAVVYEDTGTASTSSLLTHVDFEGELATDNTDFAIQWHTDGISTVST